MNNIFDKTPIWLSLKIDKVAITHLAMEIDFQTSDHVVAVEIVAEQHIGTKLCSCNTFEDISHLLIMVIIKVAITQLAMELQLRKFTIQYIQKIGEQHIRQKSSIFNSF